MSVAELILIAITGLVAGFVNTAAGGGTLLTLPLLIFLGLDATLANGTNRVAILFQNVSGILAYRQKGFFHLRYSMVLAIPALLGAVLGSFFAVRVEDQTFERTLAGVLVLSVVASTWGSTRNGRGHPGQAVLGFIGAQRWWAPLVFLGIGFYGGFIQAGVGFLILAVLAGLFRLDLVNANAVKVFVVFLYTPVALSVFILYGQVDWPVALWLTMGNVVGAWLGAHWSVGKGAIWIKRLLYVAVLAFAAKLAFL